MRGSEPSIPDAAQGEGEGRAEVVSESNLETVAKSESESPSRIQPKGAPAQQVDPRVANDVAKGQFFVVGRYEVHQRIGSGGMASVHLGRQRGAAGFSRTVAIKRLHPHYAEDPDFRALFMDEVRLASRIQHPNVVFTLDVVAAEGELLLVMEYVAGEALSKLLTAARKRNQPIPRAVTMAIMTDVLHGLHAAHEATDRNGNRLGIVHRDMTPPNIMVGVEGVARVLDFGVARAAGSIHITRAGHLIGKVAYMAPEQIALSGVCRTTDIYAAGVVLWEMLVGLRLFTGDERELAQKITKGEIDPPSKRIPGLSPAFDRVVMRALQHNPAARFPTALRMAEALAPCSKIATRTEVRRWVEGLAADALNERATSVSLVDAFGDVESPQPPSTKPEPRARPPGASFASSLPPPPDAGSSAPPPAFGSSVPPAPRVPDASLARDVPPAPRAPDVSVASDAPPPPLSPGSEPPPALSPESQPPPARSPYPPAIPVQGGVAAVAAPSAVATEPSKQPKARSRKLLIGAASVAVLVGVVIGAWALGAGRKSGPAPAPGDDAKAKAQGPAAIGGKPTGKASSAKPPAATAEPSASGPEEKPSSRSAGKRKKRTRGSRRAPKGKGKPNCNPPYVIDPSGVKQFKYECF